MTLLTRGLGLPEFPTVDSLRRGGAAERPSQPGHDYPAGFVIEEYDYNDFEPTAPIFKLALLGNLMPFAPFVWSGGQRVEKTYYPGQDEPVVQILGNQEDNIVLRGNLKSIHYGRNADREISYNAATVLDKIRQRGNLLRFTLGDWKRWGFIEASRFELTVKSRLMYELSLLIIGETPPQNVKFVRRPRRVPDDTAIRLADVLANFQSDFQEINIPDQTIFERLNDAISTVAGGISQLLNYVDAVFGVVDNIQQSITRAIAVVDRTTNRVQQMRRTLDNFDASRLDVPLSQQYLLTAQTQGLYSHVQDMLAFLILMRTLFTDLRDEQTSTTYITIQGDTLQRVAIRFFNDASAWKRIADFNNLPPGAALEVGTSLEIPA